MYTRILNLPKNQSLFLFGPRGTGKTSWLKSTYPDSPYIDLLEDETFLKLSLRPQDLASLVPKSKQKLPIIIDEVQKIPKILDEVHRLIEKEKFKFILTGSSARKLKRGGANLLGGRALSFELYPLTASELGKDFDLKFQLQFGSLPIAVTGKSPKKFLASYIRTYLKEEVQLEGFTRNIEAFHRFLTVASFSQASPLVITNIATEIGINRKVVEDYFSILRDLLLSTELPIFRKKAKRELIQKTKFFYFDCGVFRALRPTGPLDSESDINGPALETAVLQEIKALNHYREHDYEISYWHTRKHIEVDFVLYGPKGFIGLEVKASSRIRPEHLEGLLEFQKDYPGADLIFASAYPDARFEKGIYYIPVEVLIKNMNQLLEDPKKFLDKAIANPRASTNRSHTG